MSVGLLLITHGDIGAALLTTARRMFGVCPLAADAMAVRNEADAEQLRNDARRRVEALNCGDGVLVLTDMYGSTPANIAASLQCLPGVRALAGVNLPMLVRVFNYPTLGVDDLMDKALGGGSEGVMRCCRPDTLADLVGEAGER
jgi:PTS system ascorbate-specific IIA component